MLINRAPITPHDPMTLHCGLCGQPARVCTCPPCGGCERAVWACVCEGGQACFFNPRLKRRIVDD